MLRFALKSMATRRAKLVMTALSVVITAAVALMAYNISTQVSEGIVRTAAKYDLIIGPSGSATQLAMNTMFFTDKPLGTIPYALVDELKATGLVNEVVPFSMGDSYNAAPIVGTDAALLADKPLKTGAMFQEALEAVVGADVARAYDVRVGDRLVTSHGLTSAHGAQGTAHADHPLTVTGILARTDTAYDGAVFTPVSTVWAVHDHGDGEEDGEASSPAPAVIQSAGGGSSAPSHAAAMAAEPVEDNSPAGAEAHDDGEAHGEGEDHDHDAGEICAVLVRSTGFNAYSQLMSVYGGKADYLAINPNTVLREVMDNVDLSRRIVYALCVVILVMNLFVVTAIALLNMYDSRREIALMRLIGISMKRVNQLYLIQNALAGAAAMVLSLLAAHLCLLAVRGFVARMGIVLSAGRVYPMEWAILLAVFVLSILPTLICTRRMASRDGIDR